MPDHYFEGSFKINMHYDYGLAGSTSVLNDTALFNKVPWMFLYCENPIVSGLAPYELTAFTKLFFTDG